MKFFLPLLYSKALFKHLSTAIYVTLSLLIAPVLADENPSHLNFKQFTTADGLSQSYVFSIVQDEQGFLWFATEDGLNRYDGFDFVHYRNDIDNPNSLADNFVRSLFIDSKETLWVGTDNGLSRYEANKGTFINYFSIENSNESLRDNRIWDIFEGKNIHGESELIVSTDLGIHRYVEEKNVFQPIDIDGLNDKLLEVTTIFQDKKNNYWFGTYENGIYITNQLMDRYSQLNTKQSNSSRWKFNIDALSLFDLKKIDDKYWLATSNGLYILSEEYEVISHLTEDNTNGIISNNKLRTLEVFGEEHVLVASQEGTFNLIDKTNLSAAATDLNLINNKEFNHQNWIMASLKANDGGFWFGTYGSGLLRTHHNYHLISTSLNDLDDSKKFINDIVEVDHNIVWIVNDFGEAYEFDTISGKLNKIEFGIKINQIISSSKARERSIIIDDQNSIYLYDHITGELTKKEKLLSNHNVEAKHQLHLIGSNLCFINQADWLSCINIENDEHYQAIPAGEEQIKVLSLQSDDSLLLITESKNVYQYTSNKFNFEFSLSELNRANFSARGIKKSQNNYWLYSDIHGVLVVENNFKKATLLNDKNLLTNNAIADLLIDKRENAWISTNKGISVVDGESLLLKRFDLDFGLNQIEFINDESLITESGNMIFGSSQGLYSFTPDKLFSTEQTLSKPFLTSVSIANKYLKNTSLGGNPIHLEAIDVPFKQFPLKLNIVSPNAGLPHQTKYKYRLNGLEDKWIETGINDRSATYTNLSPGPYVFEYEVFDSFNPSMRKGNKIKINILPPWWMSNSAYAFYFILAALVILYFIQQLRHRQQYHQQIKKSEERLKLSLWGSGDEMWDWNINAKKIFRSNIWGILEFPQDGTRNVGTDQTNIHPNDIPHVKEALNAHFDQKTEHFETTYRVKNKDEQWIWVLDRGKIVERDDKGKPSRMTGTLKDISHIKKAEERLKLFAKCIENISDAVIIYDRQFNIVDVNKSFVRITGKTKASMLGKTLKFSRYPDTFTQAIKKHLVMHGSWQGEIESRRGNDETYYTDLTLDVIRDGNNNISHFVGVFSDITSRKQSETELRRLANSDTLTGLPNRSFFQANQLRLVKTKVPHALLVFDLDNFKKINDSMGHQVGDKILIEVAKRISKIATKRNSVYRLGGDEFSIIIENTNDIHTITSLAKNILKLVAQPLKIKSQEIVLYSSIGIVLYPEDGASPQELLKNADTAMYHAKDSGGNKYQFFSDSMNKQAVQRMQIETLIRHGLKDDLFSVFYQPKIEIATGKVAGMEALVRFETPTKGVISPVVFIPVSEETGQIIDIGEVVLRKSCFAAKKWVDAGLFDGRVAVNLSAVQFTQPNLPKVIASILEESQLPPKHLELEITEGTVMDSPQQAIETMLQIRSMGIHLSLDDFGTGYSSLAYLKKFPLNTLKIDKAFVDDIELSEQGRNMVATIVTIAHNLGMHVVAEGVENNNQLNFLSGLGCEQLQGYLYSKPLPENEFQKYLLSFQITDKSTRLLKS